MQKLIPSTDHIKTIIYTSVATTVMTTLSLFVQDNLNDFHKKVPMPALHQEEHEHEHAGKNVVAKKFLDPIVQVTAFKDTMSGYNVRIQTSNFKWSPEKAGEKVIKDVYPEGHAHIYVNGKKVGRVYGEWINLPKENFQAGTNTIMVTLNGNDHLDWVNKDGVAGVRDEVIVINN